MLSLRTVHLIALLGCGLLADRPANGENIRDCTFRCSPVRVGDKGEQNVDMRLQLKREFSQQGIQIGTEEIQLVRQQQRQIRVLDVRNNVASRVQVTFNRARQKVHQQGQSDAEQRQVIEGRTYDVHRVADALQIKSDDGHVLAPEEEQLVAAALTALGKPNLLGQLLDGKTLSVGNELAVPAEVVRDFFGEKSPTGSEMKLRLIEIEIGAICPQIAIFSADLSTPPTQTGDPGINVTGRWEIDSSTCQTVSATFQGPIEATEMKGPAGSQYQVETKGQLELKLSRASSRTIAK